MKKFYMNGNPLKWGWLTVLGEEYDHSYTDHLPTTSDWLNPAIEN